MLLAIFCFTIAAYVALFAARFAADEYKGFWFSVSSVICAIDVILVIIVLIGYLQ